MSLRDISADAQAFYADSPIDAEQEEPFVIPPYHQPSPENPRDLQSPKPDDVLSPHIHCVAASPSQNHPILEEAQVRSSLSSQELSDRFTSSRRTPTVQSFETTTDVLNERSVNVSHGNDIHSIALSESMDSNDFPFSQEQLDGVASLDSDGNSELSMSSEEDHVSVNELHGLQPLRSFLTDSRNVNCHGGELCEDLWSGIFHDFNEERCEMISGTGEVPDASFDTVDLEVWEDELMTRASNLQKGGLLNWNYESPFKEVEVSIDEVDSRLADRFVIEANTILDNVLAEAASSEDGITEEAMGFSYSTEPVRQHTRSQNQKLSRLAALRVFLPDSLLEKLRTVANRALKYRRQTLTNSQELLGFLILHIMCSSYDAGPSVVCDPKNEGFFFQMGLSAERYRQIWSAFTGSRDKRTVVDYSATGWCRSAARATSLITDIESEVAAVNRELLYVPNATVLSLDDDHLRMASRAVANLTFLQQHNNPKKGLGPVGNTVGSALTSVFFACHFTRRGEKLVHIWERLVQLLQGAATTGALRPMADAIFAADRGYNTKETLNFVGNVIGASILGTHKRDLTYPFVFGNGAITLRHKGMVVSENGCRAVYIATKKHESSARRIGRDLEACLYRESCSGRIAAMIHNNRQLFKSRSFTIVPHNRFRGANALDSLREEQIIFDTERRRPRAISDTVSSLLNTTGATMVDRTLQRVKVLTFHQSEDPVWFLLRAFRFTSRTGHSFLATVTRDYEKNLSSLAWGLRGKRLLTGCDALPEDHEECLAALRGKWEPVCKLFGMQMRTVPQRSARRELADKILRFSPSRINSFNRSNLQDNLSLFDRGVPGAPSKSVLVSAMLQLQSDLRAGTVQLDEEVTAVFTTESVMSDRTSEFLDALREASLSAWVMKPLVSTAGMKEGSRNEIEVLRAIPNFLRDTFGAFARDRGVFHGTQHCFNPIRKLKVQHIRCIGLVESRSSSMVADSPDALVAMTDELDDSFVCAAEIKTMTALATVNDASNLRDLYGPLVILSNVGACEESGKLFRSLVPSTSYRAQCMHHAATLGLRHVMYVVGTSGNVTHGRILYCCLIEFSEEIRHSYTFTLDSVHSMGFEWLGKETKYIPTDYDGLLKQSHASDINSFASYYSLSSGIRRLIDAKGSPIPPTRMIRLTPAVFWNHLKGGVDVISRYMKTLARSNISENPITSIIARLLVMQVNNAAICFRLFKAREQGKLPNSDEESATKGYSHMRHRVTECESFGHFARQLAKEWKDWHSAAYQQEPPNHANNSRHISPWFSRGAADHYNLGEHKRRRLNVILNHTPVSGQPTYCVLCSWTLRGVRNGKTVTKRKGSKQIQWCLVCRQAVCKTCWQKWHSSESLQRGTPTDSDVREFNETTRSKRRRVR